MSSRRKPKQTGWGDPPATSNVLSLESDEPWPAVPDKESAVPNFERLTLRDDSYASRAGTKGRTNAWGSLAPSAAPAAGLTRSAPSNSLYPPLPEADRPPSRESRSDGEAPYRRPTTFGGKTWTQAVAGPSAPYRRRQPMLQSTVDNHVRDHDADTFRRARERGAQKGFEPNRDFEQYRDQAFAAMRVAHAMEPADGWGTPSKEESRQQQRQDGIARVKTQGDRTVLQASRTVSQLQSQPRLVPPSAGFEHFRKRDAALDRELLRRQQKRRIFAKRLSPEREARVDALFKTPESKVASSIPGGEVTGRDLRMLKPGQWLNDEVINFYAVMINARSKQYQAELAKLPEAERPPPSKRKYLNVFCFSSFFYTKYFKEGYAAVKRWAKKNDFFAMDAVLMPINVGNSHWVAACINLRLKRFEFYDSLGSPGAKYCQTLRKYIAQEHEEKKKRPLDLSDWTVAELDDVPQQKNGFDCGVFTSQVLECLSRPDAPLDYAQKDMEYLRRKMVYEIGEQAFLDEEEYE